MPANYKLPATGYRLKIGIVCYPSVGGSGIVATNLGLELARRGHEVHFISYERPFRLTGREKNIFFHQVNINEYGLFKYPDYTLPLAVAIERVQKQHLLDVVHVHYAVPHATAALLARRIMRQNRIPLPRIVTTLHGTDITLLARDKNLFEIIKYSIERSHCVTAVSEDLKQETLQLLKTDKPIEVVYNFYTPVPATASRDAIRKKLKIKNSDFLAIHLSNLRPVKRIPDLLKIAGLMKRSPSFKLLILAGDSFLPYRPLVKKLRLQNLTVKEHVKDIQNYLNAADAGLYTSQTESFGMGMLETMSYQKPVLATKAGGIPEVLRQGQDGYLLKIGDIKGFAGKLKLLMDDPGLANKLGQNAASQASEKFSAEVIVKQYLRHYQNTCGKTA
ncbi:MAG: N-acetyl-alpha-D-glucosaminyl L-malate synthase BshA [Patescibacteria group bacterium]|nr:N-acetyl-alpha-D-glucosaminyl L-malate synthase BshA [Patescibacteria group bacterium]